MKKSILLLIGAVLFGAQVATAQEETKYWTHGGSAGLNFAQSHFSNWAAGGQDAINGVANAKYDINYVKDNLKWNNSVVAGMGYNVFDFNKAAIKTDDRLNLSSSFGYKATEKLYYSGAFTFNTQFTNGYAYSSDSVTYTNRISGLLAPAYATLGLGIDWVPNKFVSVSFTPVTGKLTIVNDQRLANTGAFGVVAATFDTLGNMLTEGAKTRWELGAQLTAKVDYEIVKNVKFTSKLVVFYDYIQAKEFNALGNGYGFRADVDWDNALSMKVNDWLSCNVTAHLIYDEDIKPIVGTSFLQFNEVLSVGLMYTIK